MDFMKQSEEIVKNWSDAQKTLWDKWAKMVQDVATPTQLDEMWQQMVGTWEENVGKTLDAQVEWTESWLNSLNSEGLPEQVLNWLDQGKSASKQWQATHSQLWHSWFDFVKQYDPARLNEMVQTEGQKAYQNWQKTAQKMMNTQMELINMWLPGQPATNGKKKAAK